MRPDHPEIPPSDDAPAWERDPVVSRALSDATAVQTSGSGWERALADVLARGSVGQEASTSKRKPLHGIMRKTSGGGISRWGLAIGSAIGGASFIAVLLLAFVFMRKTSVPGVNESYTTTTGQRASLTLSDGSRLVIAPRSRVQLVDFSTRARTVIVDGEAFFDVEHASGIPFTIRAGTTITRVLGTSFVVKHYADDANVRVAVMSGRVSVSRAQGKRDVVLVAGNVGDIDDSVVTVRTPDDLSGENGWMKDELVFNDEPMRDVFASLTRWYGFTFKYTDTTLANRHVKVGLSTQSSSKALSTLKRLLNVSLKISGDTITLLPVNARGTTPHGRSESYDVWTPSHEVGR